MISWPPNLFSVHVLYLILCSSSLFDLEYITLDVFASCIFSYHPIHLELLRNYLFGFITMIFSMMWTLAFLPYIMAAPLQSIACNNSPKLCSQSYSEITHLGCHDSAFIRNATNTYSTSGNQNFNITEQLDAGVRMLTAQVHKDDHGNLNLCHTSCFLYNAGSLQSWLSEVKVWMDNNPNDVVTLLLVNSDNFAAATLDAEFKSSGITKYAYTPSSTSTALQVWPSLQDLITANTKLITFVASLSPSSNTVAPYLLDEFTFVFENNYDVVDPNDFSCTPNRPTAVANNTALAINSGRLPLMNHFLDTKEAFDIEIPNFDASNNTNAPSGDVRNLGSAAMTCTDLYGKPPTFILVDFFDSGPAIATIDSLNGISAPVGRKTPSARMLEESLSRSPAGRARYSTAAIFLVFGWIMVWA